MSLSMRTLCLALPLAGFAFTGAARADQASGAACAKTLSPEAMTIYQTVAPEVTPSTDLRSTLKTKVKAMVIDGQVQRATARSSAVAAYGCLKDLK